MLVPKYGFNLIAAPSFPRLMVTTYPVLTTVWVLSDVKVKYSFSILVGSLCSVIPVTSKVFPSTTSENVSTRVSFCKFSEKLERVGLVLSGESISTFATVRVVMKFPVVSAKDWGSNSIIVLVSVAPNAKPDFSATTSVSSNIICTVTCSSTRVSITDPFVKVYLVEPDWIVIPLKFKLLISIGSSNTRLSRSELKSRSKELNCGGVESSVKLFAIKEASLVIGISLLGTAAKSKVVLASIAK